MSEIKSLSYCGAFSQAEKDFIQITAHKLSEKQANVILPYGCKRNDILLGVLSTVGKNVLIVTDYAFVKSELIDDFCNRFVGSKKEADKFLSADIDAPKAITLSLISAVNDKFFKSESQDREFDEYIKNNNIGVIVFDEIIRLNNEVIRIFNAATNCERDVKILFTSALLPYDSDCASYAKLASICGEPDVFAPEPYSDNCRDAAYYCLPAQSETELIKQRFNDVCSALKEIHELEYVKAAVEQCQNKQEPTREELAVRLYSRQFCVENTSLANIDMSACEKAVEYFYRNCDDRTADVITEIFRKHSLIEKKRITLSYSEKLRISLLRSPQKLQSICKIVSHERRRLGKNMVLAIATDGKKEVVTKIGVDFDMKSANAATIFEKLRTSTSENLCLISQQTTIMPSHCQKYLTGKNYTVRSVADTKYSAYEFKYSQKETMSLIGKLARQKCFSVIVAPTETLCLYNDAFDLDSIIFSGFSGDDKCADILRAKTICGCGNRNVIFWHIITLVQSEFAPLFCCETYDYTLWQTLLMRYVGSNVVDGEKFLSQKVDARTVKEANDYALDCLKYNKKERYCSVSDIVSSSKIEIENSDSANQKSIIVSACMFSVAAVIAVAVAVLPYLFRWALTAKIIMPCCSALLLAATALLIRKQKVNSKNFVKDTAESLVFACKKNGTLSIKAKVTTERSDNGIIVSIANATKAENEKFVTAFNGLLFSRSVNMKDGKNVLVSSQTYKFYFANTEQYFVSAMKRHGYNVEFTEESKIEGSESRLTIVLAKYRPKVKRIFK